MVKKKYNPAIQVAGLRDLLLCGLISDFTFIRNIRGGYNFCFNLSTITFHADDKTITKDFSKYKLSIIYTIKDQPKVFIISPDLDSDTPHLYGDKSLCLYKKINFIWQTNNLISNDLFPLICCWVYFYEVWQLSGKWLGQEAEH